MKSIYHRVMRRENFEKSAKDLLYLLNRTQQKYPDEERVLYVDIDGHLNSKGGYDQDMLELQKEFGMGFLLQFCKKKYFPLAIVENVNEQCNEIPDNFLIFNANNQKDTSLNDLYIENYSNTEFMSEDKVYEYMKKVSGFLKEYNDLDAYYRILKNEKNDFSGWIAMWRSYLKDLTIELFNDFLFGNLISSVVMTRTLIETYTYVKVLLQENSPELLNEWCLCSMIKSTRRYKDESQIKNIIEKYCISNNLDFKEKWELYSSRKENECSWLKSIISEKNITFRTICNYLKEPEIYEDFQIVCSFVHGQDLITKVSPFTFYEIIYAKFVLMMEYIYKSIALFPIPKEIKKKIKKLEIELYDLKRFI